MIGLHLLVSVVVLAAVVTGAPTPRASEHTPTPVLTSGGWQGPTLPPHHVLMVTTGYCSGQGLRCGIHPRLDNGITASGHRVKRGMCASDWTVLPKGTLVHVPGYGKCKVLDTGNLVKGWHLDLYFDTREEAIQWGRRYKIVRIYS